MATTVNNWSRVAKCIAALLAGFCSQPSPGQVLPGQPYMQGPRHNNSAVGDPDSGMRVAQAKCATCHGATGNSPDASFPKLAGQNPAYLYWQLWAFRTGARPSEMMTEIATGLSDHEMADAASFYSQQSMQPDPIRNPQMRADGERIFFAGARGRTPACAMCHEVSGRTRMPMMGMMGMTANTPTLNGQHADYTSIS
nr:cytochrome c [uncultured Ralstonia sp.]